MSHFSSEFKALNIAILTVSDTRSLAEDSSGAYLKEQAEKAGHQVLKREIIRDDVYHIRSIISQWIAAEDITIVIITGGTGFYDRDITPEAVQCLFDKEVDGFGEMFRWLSQQEIGMSTIQSRALAGIANKTLILCLPGSTGACRTAWEGIIEQQLDIRTKPCSFVRLLTE